MVLLESTSALHYTTFAKCTARETNLQSTSNSTTSFVNHFEINRERAFCYSLSGRWSKKMHTNVGITVLKNLEPSSDHVQVYSRYVYSTHRTTSTLLLDAAKHFLEWFQVLDECSVLAIARKIHRLMGFSLRLPLSNLRSSTQLNEFTRGFPHVNFRLVFRARYPDQRSSSKISASICPYFRAISKLPNDKILWLSKIYFRCGGSRGGFDNAYS